MNMGFFLDIDSCILWGERASVVNKCMLVLIFIFSKQIRYKESWSKMRDGGYKLKLDAIPFQTAKASSEIISDVSCFNSNSVYCKMRDFVKKIPLGAICLDIGKGKAERERYFKFNVKNLM